MRGRLDALLMVFLLSSASRGQPTEAIASGHVARDSVVRLEVESSRSALAEEALLRIRAELGAVGLVVETIEVGGAAGHSAGARGVLRLRERPPFVELEAEAPGLDAPIRQTVDLGRPSIDAEVIAVRAVETLRAAVVQSVRVGPIASGSVRVELPEAVRKFAHVEDEPASPVEPRLPPEQPTSTEPEEQPLVRVEDEADSSAGSPLRFYLGAAPMVRIDAFPSGPAIGLELGLGVELGWSRWGALIDTTFVPSEVETAAGHVELREFSAALRWGVAFPERTNWQVRLGLSAGAAHFAIATQPAPGYAGEDAESTSALVQGDAGFSYWLTPNAGPTCSARAGVLMDAPSLLVLGEEVARLGRPSLSLACGVDLRF